MRVPYWKVGYALLVPLIWCGVGFGGLSLNPRMLHSPPSQSSKSPFKNCKQVYLDIGSNIGVQIRKLFEPSRYPGADVIRVFDKHFGVTRNKSQDLCAIGIEMNPSHTSRLKLLEHHYTSTCNYNVKFFTETAASTHDGFVGFLSDGDHANEEWGASTNLVLKDQSVISQTKQIVQSIDIANFILKELVPHADTIVIKLDIEGAEHDVLPRLMMTGALCNVSEIFIELHYWSFSQDQKELMDMATKLYPGFFSAAGCRVQMSYIDDESYLHDVDASINTC